MQHYDPSEFEKVVLGKKLGAGTFGTVYVGLLPSGRYCAVKQLEADESAAGANVEVEVHRRLEHPNIIRYLHSSFNRNESPVKLNLYLEFVTGGSLTAIMKTLPEGRLPYSVVRVYSRHMFQGLAYLHANGVAHRDIKGDNLLVSQDTGVAKLADFDQAKVVTATMRSGAMAANTLAGTPYWIAPEVIQDDKGYNPFKADIWSAGCTVAEMFTGKAPWMPMTNPMGVMYKLANSSGWPDAIPTDEATLGADLKHFLTLTFERDPTKRPTAEELLMHPFLAV